MSEVSPGVSAREQMRCIVCGGGDARVLASSGEIEAQQRDLRSFHRRRLRVRGREVMEERADFTQDYAASVVVCEGCGLLSRDPRPTDDAVARMYATDTYGSDRLEALFESQLELFRPKVSLLRRWLAKPSPVVLEIGSFVGGFLAACAEQGWAATGIDPGREVAEFCRARGLAVLGENVDDCEFPSREVDLVAIWNTFDQLPDPHPTLHSLRRCLKPGGIVAVRVPDGRCFETCLARLRRWPWPARRVLHAAMAWNNLVSFPYLHGYSVATLDRLFGGYGFERIHARGDVLTRLANEENVAWARWEERIVKAAWLGVAAIGDGALRGAAPIGAGALRGAAPIGAGALRGAAPIGAGALRGAAPWIDVYYRAPSTWWSDA